MLASLSIRDVVLIDRLDLDLGPGLAVLTGETGAGKSILLDALGLALGARGDSGLVRAGAAQASVTAVFEVAEDHPALAMLAGQDIPAALPLILRRTVTPDGRSRAWVNDRAVGVGLLRQLGEVLVEIHGQHDQHGLLDPRTHREVLDQFGGHEALKAEVARRFREMQAADTARDRAEAEAEAVRREEDHLRTSLADLDKLKPQPGEEEDLVHRRQRLQNADRIVAALNAALDALNGEPTLEVRLLDADRALQRLPDAETDERVRQLRAGLERASIEIGEGVAGVERLLADLDLGEDSLEVVEDRLYALRAAARRHQVTTEDLPELARKLRARLELIDGGGTVAAKLTAAAAEARRVYRKAAEALSQARKAAADELIKAIAAELGPLRMGRVEIAVAFEPLPEDAWGPEGIERCQFMVRTNPGAPAGPLARVASGGELSRLMLALKVVLARTASAGTLVFDEVDSGIGGAVADAVGERLQRLGGHAQVLVVTHNPQVAARGDLHLRVAKRIEGETTLTEVRALTAAERREEVARMLSGAELTAEARAAADRLMSLAVRS
ncbi:DNA repair protein RecN [Tistrella mobilis]|jgi:DNA repair protein RecN (Recombination protein N)|uniref:DNA repair protein RecN n=1 Tax=Tistrella mobilis TaxID=171437 RepID=UPI0035583C6B